MDADTNWRQTLSTLPHGQAAEVKQFITTIGPKLETGHILKVT